MFGINTCIYWFDTCIFVLPSVPRVLLVHSILCVFICIVTNGVLSIPLAPKAMAWSCLVLKIISFISITMSRQPVWPGECILCRISWSLGDSDVVAWRFLIVVSLENYLLSVSLNILRKLVHHRVQEDGVVVVVMPSLYTVMSQHTVRHLFP